MRCSTSGTRQRMLEEHRPVLGPGNGPRETHQVLQTDHFVRFERVTSVHESPRGVVAQVHGETFAVDVVADDVVRLRMSRGGAFDESPTFALCVDPLAQPVEFRVEHAPDRVRVVTPAMEVSVWLDPFRVDVHRSDGTPVIETAADEDGRYWAYATLNDAFTVRRRCRQEDAVYGLGEKTGRHNRKGRDFTLWNADVLDPNAACE